jgi:hypothetical protein
LTKFLTSTPLTVDNLYSFFVLILNCKQGARTYHPEGLRSPSLEKKGFQIPYGIFSKCCSGYTEESPLEWKNPQTQSFGRAPFAVLNVKLWGVVYVGAAIKLHASVTLGTVWTRMIS